MGLEVLTQKTNHKLFSNDFFLGGDYYPRAVGACAHTVLIFRQELKIQWILDSFYKKNSWWFELKSKVFYLPHSAEKLATFLTGMENIGFSSQV